MADEKASEEPKPVSETDGDAAKKEAKPLSPADELRRHLNNIHKAVSLKEHRYTTRVLRAIASTRSKLSDGVLRKVILEYLPKSSENAPLLKFLVEPMEDESSAAEESSAEDTVAVPGEVALTLAIPELTCYLHLLVLIFLLDGDQKEQAVSCATSLVEKVNTFNRRSLDAIGARCYFYYGRAYELVDRMQEIRSALLARLRTSTLHFDAEGQATVTNLILRNLLHFRLYDQANKLILKIVFPPSAPNSECARFMYYCGVIKAVMLEYTEANNFLLQALQKAPQNTAIGFRQTVNRFSIVVQLLLGLIPDRALFRQSVLKKPLQPYFELTQAVRGGDLQQFTEVCSKFHEKFEADKTINLIIRLRQNVIKAGIRKISLSYSRISLADVADRLRLGSAVDAEFIVAKAIRDGVIEACIDHKGGFMQSKDTQDQYSTTEPQAEFHKRISFCLNLHNQSVKAMRYPEKVEKEKPEAATAAASS
eukprot:scpid25353/ scgid11903/ 26S proteasome non-ATPase regulatory subunit 3; 26S proteasome regulatory subunit RPN3; 26S proteasome regulatory subunit S3; Proteasome subunit p58